jgi:prepilin-type N-terminal cleavage/methylation domain-containing protein
MNKPGFSLIELLVASLIASILGTLLFTAFYQINRFVPVIDNRTTIIEKAALLNAQLEKDFAGIIVPNEFYERSSLRQEASADKQPKDKQNEKKDAKQEAKEIQPKADKKKPLEKIFYSINKAGMLDQLTFLTTSSLQVYWGPKAGSAKPRIVRVLYKLKENPATKDGKKSYSLIRKESPKLEFDEIEKGLEYVLVDNVKSLTMDYTAVLIEPEKKPATNQGQKPAQKPQIEIKQLSEWKEKTQKEETEKDQNQKQMPLVPQVISLDLGLWDATKKRGTSFVFTYKVPGEFALKKSTEDFTGKMLGTLKEMFGQIAPPNKPTQVAQRQQSPFTFGQRRR